MAIKTNNRVARLPEEPSKRRMKRANMLDESGLPKYSGPDSPAADAPHRCHPKRET